MALRESDDCIVPLTLEDQSSRWKPGNAGVGKAVRPTGVPERALSALSCRFAVNPRSDSQLSFGEPGVGWEPDAVTRHVGIYEGQMVNAARFKYCDTTTGNEWQTVNTKRNLNQRDHGLLTAQSSSVSWAMVAQPLGPGNPGRSLDEE